MGLDPCSNVHHCYIRTQVWLTRGQFTAPLCRLKEEDMV